MRNKSIQQMVITAMMIALAIIFHSIETMIPLPVPIPGFRLGLANIVGLVALFRFDSKTMIMVNFMRVLFGSMLNGTIFSHVFMLSAGGVLLSTTMTLLLHKYSGLSKIGISLGSSVAHCVGQILVATFIYSQALIIAYLPVLLILSIPTGIMVGVIATLALKRLK